MGPPHRFYHHENKAFLFPRCSGFSGLVEVKVLAGAARAHTGSSTGIYCFKKLPG